MIIKTVSSLLILLMMFSSVENKTTNSNTPNIENETAITEQENFTLLHVYYNPNLSLAEIDVVRQEYLAKSGITLHTFQPINPYHDLWKIDPILTGGTASIENTIEEDDRVCRRPSCED